MRVIPVLDIFGGCAVHARAGKRDSYAPLSSQLARQSPGDATAIAVALRRKLGFQELYIADLDAITGRAPQRELRRAIAAELPEVALWVDAGIRTAEQALQVRTDGASRAIVGLETLSAHPGRDPRTTLEELAVAIGLDGPRIADQPAPAGQSDAPAPHYPTTCQPDSLGRSVPAHRAAFSLDLRDGRPIAADPALRDRHPLEIAGLAAECGMQTIIVLDLARVGMGTGPDASLLREIRRALPRIELVAGGGLRDAADLELLADAGVDAALVGSALHHGSTAHGSILWLCGVSASDVTSPAEED